MYVCLCDHINFVTGSAKTGHIHDVACYSLANLTPTKHRSVNDVSFVC